MRGRESALRAGALLALTLLWPLRAAALASDEEVKNGPAFPLSSARPDPRMAPGATNPDVTPETLERTICKRGYTKSIRPPQEYTYKIKKQLIHTLGYAEKRLRFYQLDHTIPLQLGGHPSDPRNLFPIPWRVEGGWSVLAKDDLGDALKVMVCRRSVPLEQAQREIAGDWIAAYKKYIAESPQSAEDKVRERGLKRASQLAYVKLKKHFAKPRRSSPWKAPKKTPRKPSARNAAGAA